MNAPEPTDVYQFMELRAPYTPELASFRLNYIRDEVLKITDDKLNKVAFVDADLQSEKSSSTIGQLIYNKVFCGTNSDASIVDSVLKLLPPYQASCAENIIGRKPNLAAPLRGLVLTDLERHCYFQRAGTYYLIPDRVDTLEIVWAPQIKLATVLLERARIKLDLVSLTQQLETIFNVRPLSKIVFDRSAYTALFLTAKRSLFDALYLLYVLRRLTTVNFENIIEGLRVLHVLETLAIDTCVRGTRGGASQVDADLRRICESVFSELLFWDGSTKLPTLPLIKTAEDLAACFRAAPIVHPIFARLSRYRSPFNDIKPIGIGEYKVVRQWLVAYLPGEIARVENVLKGEFSNKIHRTLEKTEETFSFATSTREATSTDTQTTDRFELKREIENVVNTQLTAGASTSITYSGLGVVANVAANFSYKQDTSQKNSTSTTVAKETIAKAVHAVEKNVSEARSATKIFETEDTEKHGFDNRKGNGHVRGVYVWLDKKYKAQIFNFGRRMMFEFIVPEPASYFVESRLRGFEMNLECPQKPQEPILKTVNVGFGPSDIDENKFRELYTNYKLTEFEFPDQTKKIAFVNQATGADFFKEEVSGGDSNWYAKSYTCQIDAKGYSLSGLTVEGFILFEDSGEGGGREQNIFEIYLGGELIAREENESIREWVKKQEVVYSPPDGPITINADQITLTLGFWDVERYYLTLFGMLTMAPETFSAWQNSVFAKIVSIEQERVDRENQELTLSYNEELSTYRNRLAELRALSVNSLLQGQSEAANRTAIAVELNKHCITLLTYEFDSDPTNDIVSNITSVVPVPGDFSYRRFRVQEGTTTTTCSFEEVNARISYPAIDIREALKKGRFTQFIEQAFEWPNISYLFYPYFWAKQGDWVAMMSRSDQTDPNLTAFLTAGAARVLLAVTPAYAEAVLHFLATGEPWDGGPAPVIGDPLFIPLHDELRKQQDPFADAVPEGDPWTFVLPTSLIYLQEDASLPQFPDPAGAPP